MTNSRTDERAVLYGRISQEAGRIAGGTMRSNTLQEDETTREAQARGCHVVSWDLDMDVSGGLFQRPGFQRALDMFRTGEADLMIVPALDRFGRDMKVIYKALEIIEDAGGYLVSVKDHIKDSRTEEGRQQVALYGMFAQTQLDRIKTAWKHAHAAHVRDGIPSRVAFGYIRDDDRRLTPSQDAKWVTRMFELRIAGKSYTEIANTLNEAGVRTRSGRQWRDDSVKVVLANRVYLGEVRYGKTLVNPEAHTPLVEPGTFFAAQAIKSPTRAPARNEGLLAGLLRCASCRYVMDYKGASGTRSAHYQCKRQHGGGICEAPVTVAAAEIERYVSEWVQATFERERVIGEVPLADVAELEQRVRETEANQALFEDDLDLVRIHGKEKYKAQLARYVAAAHDAREALAQATVSTGPAVSPQALAAMPMKSRRRVLGGGIDCVFLRGRPGRGRRLPIEGRVLILARGDGPRVEELPRRGDGGLRYVVQPFAFPDDAEADAGVQAA